MVNEIDNPEYLEIIREYHRKLVTHMNATRDLYRGYQWSLRPWNKNFTPSWDNEGFTRQREMRNMSLASWTTIQGYL